MKTPNLSHVSGALASFLIVAATAGTSADDADNIGAATNVSCCDQTAVSVQTCVTGEPTLATTESLLRIKSALSAEAAARKPRHTFTAFGFVISGNKNAEGPEGLDRDVAGFAEIQSSAGWSREDAERQPRGLRLLSWSW